MNSVKYMKNRLLFYLLLSIMLLLPMIFFATFDEVSLQEGNKESEVLMEDNPQSSETTSWDYNGVVIPTTFPESYQIISDGSGGAIIAWNDVISGDYEIFAQKYNSTGAEQWTAGGIDVTNNDIYNQYGPYMVSDGSGGAIIAWMDEIGGFFLDIYARRVNPSGGGWGPKVVCTVLAYKYNLRLMGDGLGGAIFTWADERDTGNKNIYAQKINSTGAVKWTTDGETICNALGDQESVDLASDGSGGAIIAWEDQNTGDIYGQRINSTGDTQWTANGTVIIDYTGHQGDPFLVSDGSEGAIITWADSRGGNIDIYTQKINSTGDTQWIANGTVISNATGTQSASRPISDGSGGAIITWVDERNGFSNRDIYTQKINSTGSVKWITNGTVICNAADEQYNPKITTDGSGGAIITWQDRRGGSTTDIYAQQINSTGALQWADNGTAICTATGNQAGPEIAGDGLGGAIIVWWDERTGKDIYRQRIIPNDPPEVNHPDDIITTTSGGEMISWNITDDRGSGKYRILANDTSGSYYTWVDWIDWTNNTNLNIKINRAQTGIFNYTIEYTDNDTVSGTPDMVIVTINPAPNITIIEPRYNKLFNATTPLYNLTFIDAHLNETWYRLWNGTEWSINYTIGGSGSQRSGQIDQDAWNNCPNGTVVIEFYANDTVNNIGMNSTTIRKDVLGPIITINDPTPNELFSSTAPGLGDCNVDFRDVSGIDARWYMLINGTDNTDYTNNHTWNDEVDQFIWEYMDNGTVIIRIFANDSLGYIGMAEVTVRKDIESQPDGQIPSTGDDDDDNDDDDQQAIPFGNFYLLFIVVGIVGGVIYYKKKHSIIKDR